MKYNCPENVYNIKQIKREYAHLCNISDDNIELELLRKLFWIFISDSIVNNTDIKSDVEYKEITRNGLYRLKFDDIYFGFSNEKRLGLFYKNIGFEFYGYYGKYSVDNIIDFIFRYVLILDVRLYRNSADFRYKYYCHIITSYVYVDTYLAMKYLKYIRQKERYNNHYSYYQNITSIDKVLDWDGCITIAITCKKAKVFWINRVKLNTIYAKVHAYSDYTWTDSINAEYIDIISSDCEMKFNLKNFRALRHKHEGKKHIVYGDLYDGCYIDENTNFNQFCKTKLVKSARNV